MAKDAALVNRLHELARKQPRYGYRRIYQLLKREGWNVNVKRVHRIWRQEGLQVRQKKYRKKASGSSDNACFKKRANFPNEVWTYDFAFEMTIRGSTVKVMPIVDEYTRQCHSILVKRTINSEDVFQELLRLFKMQPTPKYIRSDNGGEYTAKRLIKRLKDYSVETLHIAPGSPWENGYCESFIGKLRDELLEIEIFGSLKEAQILIERFRKHYNSERPHSSLEYLTPDEFAQQALLAG